MRIEIRRLTPELIEDYFDFFDNSAFCDNPDWAGCYCDFYHCSDAVWEKRTVEQNKEAVNSRILSGKMGGYLAYADGKPVGWCHADAYEHFERLDGKDAAAGEKTGAIVCFTIAAEYRRKGIASALLKRVCADFAAEGYSSLIAYPKLAGKSDAENYHGPLEMYLAQGFTTAAEDKEFAIVKKSLQY